MNLRWILPFTILLIFSIIYFSCDNATGPVSNVSGVVYSYTGAPAPNLKVTIGGRSVYTSITGNFSFNNVPTPYDVLITDTLERSAVFYKGLSLSNIRLKLDKFIYPGDPATVRVRLPAYIYQSNLYGKIIFTSENGIASYADMNRSSVETYVIIQPGRLITGKVIVLTYTKDSAGILTYENYGESPDFQISPGSTYFQTFDSLSVSLNPGEQAVEGSFVTPPDYSQTYSGFYLSFITNSYEYYFGSSSFEFVQLFGNTFNVTVPTGIPKQYNIIIDKFGNTNSGSLYESYYVSPDIYNQLEIKTPPELVSPENQASGINRNTQFDFIGGSGDGVYSVRLHNVSRNIYFTIVTSDNNFDMQGLDEIGFGQINNNIFYWGVDKTGPANSVNDLVSGNSYSMNNFRSSGISRMFSTAP